METPRRGLLLLIAMTLSLPVLAREDNPADVPADVPVRIEKDLFHPPVRLRAADGIIDTGPSGGHAGPWVADVDGDGLNDLIVGDFSGLFRFYRNVGTNQQPRYARPINLQAGGADAKVPIY